MDTVVKYAMEKQAVPLQRAGVLARKYGILPAYDWRWGIDEIAKGVSPTRLGILPQRGVDNFRKLRVGLPRGRSRETLALITPRGQVIKHRHGGPSGVSTTGYLDDDTVTGAHLVHNHPFTRAESPDLVNKYKNAIPYVNIMPSGISLDVPLNGPRRAIRPDGVPISYSWSPNEIPGSHVDAVSLDGDINAMSRMSRDKKFNILDLTHRNQATHIPQPEMYMAQTDPKRFIDIQKSMRTLSADDENPMFKTLISRFA